MIPLATLLDDYARTVATGAGREEVSARVERVAGFQNRVDVGGGHRSLIDEPVTFGGRGEAADPAETLLGAIGASLSVTLTAHAAMTGVAIDKIRIELGGWMAADSFFRPEGDAPPGLQELRVRVTLASAAGEPALRALLDTALVASPVVQSLRVAPLVSLEVEP